MSLFDTIKKAVKKVTTGELGSDIYDLTHSGNEGVTTAKPSTQAPAPTATISQPTSVTGQKRSMEDILSGRPTLDVPMQITTPEPVSIPSIVNTALGKLELAGETIKKQGLPGTAGPTGVSTAIGEFLKTPRNVVEGVRSGIDASAEAIGLAQAGAPTSAIVSKALKTVVDPALSVISATKIPLLVQAGLNVTGLADEAQGGINSIKEGTSGFLKNTLNIDADVADELGSTLVDGIQTALSIKGGRMSAKAGDITKVQSIANTARQAEIVNTLKTKAAARPGATKASIKAEVDAALPQIRQATAKQLTVGDVAKHNLKMLGYDVAANTALPVLGIAMQSVKNGEFGDVKEALDSFVANAGVTLATSIPGFKGIKRTNKNQMQIGENVKPDIEPELKTISLPDGQLKYSVKDNRMTIEEVTSKKKGTGTKLMEMAYGVAENMNLDGVDLTAVPLKKGTSIEGLMKFYEKLGYTRVPGTERGFTKTVEPRFVTRNLEQEARDRVIKEKQDAENKAIRQESIYGDLPPEAMNQAQPTKPTAIHGNKAKTFTSTETYGVNLPIRELTTDVAEYLDHSIDNLISKGETNKDKLFVRVYNKITESIGRQLSTLESENLGRVIQGRIDGNGESFIDIKNQKQPDAIIEAGLLTPDEVVKTPTIESTTRDAQKLPQTFDTNQSVLMSAEQPATGYTLKLGRLMGATGRIFKNIADRVSLGDINRIGSDGRVVDFGNYLDQAWKNINTGTIKNVQRFSGIVRDSIAPLTSFNKKWNDADFIGMITPRGIEITSKNVKEFRKSFDNIDTLSENISLDGFTNKDINAINKASHIYSLLKGNQKALDKYFSPEQQAILTKLDESFVAGQRSVGEKMQKDGVYNGVLDDDYFREVMTYKNWERIPQELKEPVTIRLANGTVRTFDDIVQAESFVRMARVRGEKLTPDMENISTLSKTKGGDNLDVYRIHGAIPSWISYMKAVGELYADTHAAKELNAVSADARTSKYIEDIRNNFFDKGIGLEDRILGLSRKTKGEKAAEKITGGLTAITLGVPTWALSGVQSTAKNLADAISSAGINIVKGRPIYALKDIGGALKATPGTLIGVMRANMGGASKISRESKAQAQAVQQALYNEGFVTGWEVGESAAGQTYLANISGARQENAAKTDAALRSMRRVLADNGYKTSDVTSIVDQWNRFKQEKPNDYIYERNNVYNDTIMLGDMSRQARLGFLGAQRLLGPIKTFQTGLVSRFANDILRVVDGMSGIVREGTTNPEQAMKAAYRIALGIAGPAYLYQAIYSSLPDDMDDKLKNAVADYWQQRIWTSSWQDTAQFAQGLFDAVPVEKSMQLIKTVYDGMSTYFAGQDIGMEQKDTMKAIMGGAVDNLRRSIAPLRDINRIYATVTGTTGQDEITRLIGTPNIENATQYGLDTGNRIDSRTEAFMELMGFGIDSIATNLIRNPEKIGSNVQLRQGLTDFINPIRAFKNADIKRNWEDSTIGTALSGFAGKITGGGDDVTSTTTSGQRQVYKQSVYDVLTALDNKNVRIGSDKEMVQNMLGQLNIDPRWSKLVYQEMVARLETIAKANEKVEERIREHYDPRKVTGENVLEKIQDLHDKNPKGYNDFVSWLAEFQQAEQTRAKNGVQASFNTFTQKQNGALIPDNEADASYIEGILGKYRDSSSLADQAIADYNNERSLTTSAINQAFKALEIVKGDIGKISPSQINEKLQNISDYLTFLEKSGNYTGNHTDAAALKTFGISNTLGELADSKVLGEKILKPFPVIVDYLRRALSVRGEDVPEYNASGVVSSKPRSQATTGQKSTGGYTAPKTLTELTGGAPLALKQPKLTKLKLQDTKYKKHEVKPEERRLTLSELMNQRRK